LAQRTSLDVTFEKIAKQIDGFAGLYVLETQTDPGYCETITDKRLKDECLLGVGSDKILYINLVNISKAEEAEKAVREEFGTDMVRFYIEYTSCGRCCFYRYR